MSTALIGSFGASYTVDRDTGSSYVNGRAVSGGTTVVNITASIQPFNGKEIERLPEGQRSNRTIKIYTTTRLFTARVNGQTKPDLVNYDSTKFEVFHVENWTPTDLDHYKCYAVEIDETGP